MSAKRPLQELLTVDEPAWPTVESWIRAASNSVEVLPANEDAGCQALQDTQVTVRSPMGAIVHRTGGLLIDQGWLRVLGSGHPRLSRSMPEWNRGRSTTAEGQPLGFWLIADDVVGGFYALNGGAFGPGTGHVFYFAPDTLRWEAMNGMNYGQFLVWSFSPAPAKFYESLRWTAWESEVHLLNGDQGFSFYPPLWTREGKDPAQCSRRAIPIAEIFGLNIVELPKQLQSGIEPSGH